MLTIDAVLFDMDGTLSDTEVVWHRAQKQIIETYGTPQPEGTTPEQVGTSMQEDARMLQEYHGVQLSASEIIRVTVECFLRFAAEGFDWKPGAPELLAEAKQRGIPRALVTSSPRTTAEAITGHLPAASFDTIVTGEDVTQPKPAAEPYAMAAQQLGVDATRSIAFEDSPIGAQSALAAGCFVVVAAPEGVIEPAPRQLVVSSLAGVTLDDLLGEFGLEG